MHCSMVSPCVIHPGNAGTVTVYPPSSVSGSRIIVYFRIIDSPLMYALFSHPLLMPIIPMGQLNRKGHKAVKIDDCGNTLFSSFLGRGGGGGKNVWAGLVVAVSNLKVTGGGW